MIFTAADVVGDEIDLSWGEIRRDMVFYGAASGVAKEKKKTHCRTTTRLLIFQTGKLFYD